MSVLDQVMAMIKPTISVHPLTEPVAREFLEGMCPNCVITHVFICEFINGKLPPHEDGVERIDVLMGYGIINESSPSITGIRCLWLESGRRVCLFDEPQPGPGGVMTKVLVSDEIDEDRPKPDRELTDDDIRRIDAKIDAVIPPEDPGVEY